MDDTLLSTSHTRESSGSSFEYANSNNSLPIELEYSIFLTVVDLINYSNGTKCCLTLFPLNKHTKKRKINAVTALTYLAYYSSPHHNTDSISLCIGNLLAKEKNAHWQETLKKKSSHLIHHL